MKNRNTTVDMDAYKLLHHMMQKPGYEWLTSYAEARFGARYDDTVVVGMHKVIGDSVGSVTKEQVAKAAELSEKVFGYNGINTEIWNKVADLGYIPCKITGIPEGYTVPVGTPLLKVEPTEKWFAPVCNGLETSLMRIWYPVTLASRLRQIRLQVNEFYENTGTPELAAYAINDFSARSGSCAEQSDIAGMVHLLVCGNGSDNIGGQLLLNEVYGENHKLASVWATEHSVALSFGPGEGEYEYVKHQLRSHKGAIKSIVADTYDYNNFVENVMRRSDVLKLMEEHEGRIVIRPDSGNFYDNVLWTLESLGKFYGTVENDKGYKVVNYNIGVIQGDGMNEDTIVDLYQYIIDNGWSADNIVVGAGTGIMYSDLTRDTQRFAIKPSANIINGELVYTVKDPKTDPTKRSKGGLLKVDKNLVTHSSMEMSQSEFDAIEDIMETYYIDGKLSVPNLEEIEKRLNA